MVKTRKVKTGSTTKSTTKKTTKTKRITLAQVRLVGIKLGIDFSVLDIKTFKRGIMVELEHGKANKLTDVTNNNLLKTGKIALAHILEFPDYYERLDKMEDKAKKYWKNKKKPKILL